MKKIDLGQMITILANVGVIAGIVFLAVEVGQNNSQLESQTRVTMYNMRANLQSDYVNNIGGLADLYAKSQQGEQMTRAENGRLNARRAHILRTLEFMFREDRQGTF